MAPARIETDSTTGGADSHNDTLPVSIVGAGPVGLLLALLLARKGIRSKVFEQGSELDSSPRAVLHLPLTLEVFKAAGIYDAVSQLGMHANGNCWRGPPVDDGNGGRVLGPVIAEMQTSERQANGKYEDGKFGILLGQGRLVEVILNEINQTGLAEVVFNASVTGVEQDESGVNVEMEFNGRRQVVRSQYLVGCDGARSAVRKSLGIAFSGLSLPERLIAADVRRTVPRLEKLPPHFVVDPVHWGVVVPVEPVTPDEPSVWRYAMVVPDHTLTNEEAEADDYVNALLDHYIDGAKTAERTIVRRRAYRLNQRLASTMHRGRVLLAGDAAHINNPIGGMGLITGLLDADILYQVLDMILNNDYHDPQDLLAEYSAARRRLFQTLVDPISHANKIRLSESKADDAAREDWFLRMLRRKDPQEIHSTLAPLDQVWRTDLRWLIKVQAGSKTKSANSNGPTNLAAF